MKLLSRTRVHFSGGRVTIALRYVTIAVISLLFSRCAAYGNENKRPWLAEWMTARYSPMQTWIARNLLYASRLTVVRLTDGFSWRLSHIYHRLFGILSIRCQLRGGDTKWFLCEHERFQLQEQLVFDFGIWFCFWEHSTDAGLMRRKSSLVAFQISLMGNGCDASFDFLTVFVQIV